jgi:hypothetical protein
VSQPRPGVKYIPDGQGGEMAVPDMEELPEPVSKTVYVDRGRLWLEVGYFDPGDGERHAQRTTHGLLELEGEKLDPIDLVAGLSRAENFITDSLRSSRYIRLHPELEGVTYFTVEEEGQS